MDRLCLDRIQARITSVTMQHLLRFLTAAGANKAAMPDVFTKDGDDDCVVVSGDVDFSAPDKITFIYNGQLSYTFA